MFRRYTVTYADDTVLVQLRGDVPSRRYVWAGAVDALLLAGHQRFVVDLQGLDLQRDSDAEFVGAVAAQVQGCGGAVVVLPPSDPHAQRLLRRNPATAHLSFVSTPGAGVELLALGQGPSPDAQRLLADPGSLRSRMARSARRVLSRGRSSSGP